MMRLWSLIGVLGLALAVATTASAGTVWDQGFETDAAGWLDDDDFAGFGNIDQVASGGGTLGLTSASGSGHAEVQQVGPVGDESGPFSRFDGYRSSWPGGMTASIDIYLDTQWGVGEGFDYSVAANGSDGNHLRDFIFHVTQDTSTGDLLVAGSNNTNFDPREDLETLNHIVIVADGWYTFEHVFYDAGDGTLAVDMNLRASDGTLLFTETRNAASDVIATVVGGNRYSWFTNVDIASGIAVDNHTLTIVPEPSSALLAALSLFGVRFAVRRRDATKS
jgi:hypothetical protein